MKTILPVLFAMISLSAAAQAGELAALSCVASNGVVLKGEAKEGEALTVKSQWGLFTQQFAATLAPESTAEKTLVNLVSKDAGQFQLVLNTAKPKAFAEDPQYSGTILQPSTVRGGQPQVVALVRCAIRIR
jgi:hypothetical protein